jgi:hypothetical protein
MKKRIITNRALRALTLGPIVLYLGMIYPGWLGKVQCAVAGFWIALGVAETFILNKPERKIGE